MGEATHHFGSKEDSTGVIYLHALLQHMTDRDSSGGGRRPVDNTEDVCARNVTRWRGGWQQREVRHEIKIQFQNCGDQCTC